MRRAASCGVWRTPYPSTVDTELSAHLRDGAPQAIGRQVQGMELLCPEGIADTVSYIVTPDCRVADGRPAQPPAPASPLHGFPGRRSPTPGFAYTPGSPVEQEASTTWRPAHLLPDVAGPVNKWAA